MDPPHALAANPCFRIDVELDNTVPRGRIPESVGRLCRCCYLTLGSRPRKLIVVILRLVLILAVLAQPISGAVFAPCASPANSDNSRPAACGCCETTTPAGTCSITCCCALSTDERPQTPLPVPIVPQIEELHTMVNVAISLPCIESPRPAAAADRTDRADSRGGHSIQSILCTWLT